MRVKVILPYYIVHPILRINITQYGDKACMPFEKVILFSNQEDIEICKPQHVFFYVSVEAKNTVRGLVPIQVIETYTGALQWLI